MNNRATARRNMLGCVQTLGADNASGSPIRRDHLATETAVGNRDAGGWPSSHACLQELAEPGVAAEFIANELPADFVQGLTDDRAAIDTAKDDVESEDNENVASTAAIGRLVRAGMKDVNYLNAIMHNKYSRDADKLRAWKSASHIDRAPKREKAPASGFTPTKPNL